MNSVYFGRIAIYLWKMYKSLGSWDVAEAISNRQLTVLKSTSAFMGVLQWQEVCLCFFLESLPYLSLFQLSYLSYTPLHTSNQGILTILQSLVEKTAFLPVDGLFSVVWCLLYWFPLFLASLLSAVSPLMLEEMHQCQRTTYLFEKFCCSECCTDSSFNLGYSSTTQLCANLCYIVSSISVLSEVFLLSFGYLSEFNSPMELLLTQLSITRKLFNMPALQLL